MIGTWNKLRTEYGKKKIFMPIEYWVFLITIVRFYWRGDLNSVKLNYFLSEDINRMIIQVFDFLYSNSVIEIVVSVCSIVAVIIFMIFSSTSAYKLLPAEVRYSNGKTVSWNYISASKRLLYALKWYSTKLWIWYFFFNVFFNGNYFINNFITKPNKYPFFNIFFIVNIILLLWYIVSSIFKINTGSFFSEYIKKDQAHDMFVPIDETRDSDSNKIMIWKPKSNLKDQYLLVRELNDGSFMVIDTAIDLDEIKMHFDSLSEGRLTTNW